MRARLVDVGTIASNGMHLGFTDLCQWRGNYYVAYRQAMTHGIVPKGEIVVQVLGQDRDGNTLSFTNDCAWLQWSEAIAHPTGDVRDPRLIPTKEALYLMCGCYLPAPQHHHLNGLSAISSNNLIVTMLTYTTDGMTWAPLTPILRPQHWGWSVLRHTQEYLVAAYVTGSPYESNSIVLWSGKSLFGLAPLGTIYEGASYEHEGHVLSYPDTSPSEMVLYAPDTQTVACLLRTSGYMNLGLMHNLNMSWRWRQCDTSIEWTQEMKAEGSMPATSSIPEWWTTGDRLHPSAILHTPYGWLLAARRLKPVYKGRAGKRVATTKIDHFITSTDLFQVRGQYVTHLLQLPSAGDTGYCGLAPGQNAGEYVVSYYDQSAYYQQGDFGVSLPSADIKIAVIALTKETHKLANG